jgi:ribosomal protein S18 acetylase RimI-like enzyme
MEIRRVTEDDWELLKDVRLRALAEAPYAFGSTLERERDRTEEEWREWAARGRHDSGGATFAAVDGHRFVGMAGGFDDDEEGVPPGVHLVAMWVDPAVRRQGVGADLVEAVVTWARERGAPEVHLWVADGNDAARSLYRRLGFEPTGVRQPLPSNPSVGEEMLRLRLP